MDFTEPRAPTSALVHFFVTIGIDQPRCAAAGLADATAVACHHGSPRHQRLQSLQDDLVALTDPELEEDGLRESLELLGW